MVRKKSRDKKKEQEIAKEHIESSFIQAAKSSDLELATRLVKSARKIAMKFRVPIPSKFRRKFCKHCYSYLVPGRNLRVRTRKNKVVYYCLECKKFSRFGFLKEKKEKRRKNAK